MEAALRSVSDGKKPSSASKVEADKISAALQKLHAALQSALPLLLDHQNSSNQHRNVQRKSNGDGGVTVAWLLKLCQTVPSELDAVHLAQAVVEAAHLEDGGAQQEAALFDALGASEEAMQVLFEVAPMLGEIRSRISREDLFHIAESGGATTSAAGTTTTTTMVDVEEERRQFLLREAMDAAQVAAVAQAEVDELLGRGSGNAGPAATTHTILRTSEIQAKKAAEKAAKRAAQALQRAKDAGAILDEIDLLRIDQSQLGDGGLMHRNRDDMWALQQSLLPEGSREYYDTNRGLPRNAIREQDNDMEKVILPAMRMDPKQVATRLKIAEIMDANCARAFEGTASLNPMQSKTFDVAFHSRDNMMVCAPTGAGKTNVAMLAVVAHFRDVGLIGGNGGANNGNGALDTGSKAVYIAPMKGTYNHDSFQFTPRNGVLVKVSLTYYLTVVIFSYFARL